MKEIVSFPLISPGLVELWGAKEEQVDIKNPFSRAILSPSLSPFICAGGSKINVTRGRNDWGLFEIGKVFRRGLNTPFQEEKRLFMALTGYSLPPLVAQKWRGRHFFC